jgi:hypothetical protein
MLGIPRRYALQPPGTAGYSLVGSIFALLLALGFLCLSLQLAPLARAAWKRRHDARVRVVEPRPVETPRCDGVPLATPAQLAVGAAGCVVGLAAFFPQIVQASETSVRYHHLDHAGQFLFGVVLGLLLGSLPVTSRRLGERGALGLATVVVAPTLTMLVMVPRFYEPLEAHPSEHVLYHLAMAALGLVTGVAATRLGRISGRFAAFLAVGMAVMFAAAMR